MTTGADGSEGTVNVDSCTPVSLADESGYTTSGLSEPRGSTMDFLNGGCGLEINYHLYPSNLRESCLTLDSGILLLCMHIQGRLSMSKFATRVECFRYDVTFADAIETGASPLYPFQGQKTSHETRRQKRAQSIKHEAGRTCLSVSLINTLSCSEARPTKSHIGDARSGDGTVHYSHHHLGTCGRQWCIKHTTLRHRLQHS